MPAKLVACSAAQDAKLQLSGHAGLRTTNTDGMLASAMLPPEESSTAARQDNVGCWQGLCCAKGAAVVVFIAVAGL
jgi:hypothetical protein